MLTDEELLNLPHDLEMAFVEFDNRLIEIASIRLRQANSENERLMILREVIRNLSSYIKAFGVPLNVPAEGPTLPNDFDLWYKKIRAGIEQYKLSSRFNHIKARRQGLTTIIPLHDDYRALIHTHLDEIRKVVRKAGITEKKRNVIYERIAALALEVDKPHTKTEAALVLWYDVTNAIGEGAKNLDPALDQLERIMKLFGRAKASEDQKFLPPSDHEVKLLTGPENTTAPGTAEADSGTPHTED